MSRLRIDMLRVLAAGILASCAQWAPAGADELDPALVTKGRQLFETAGGVGCKACHGAYGEGKIGPTNRGVNEATIREALAKIGAMQFLKEQLGDGDIAQLAAYTDWMGRHLLVRTVLKRGRFIPEAVAVYPGTPIQLIVENTGSEPSTVSSERIVATPQTIPPRESASIEWTAPAAEGTFTMACGTCKIKDGLLTIEVTRTAKPYVPPPQPRVLAKP